MNKNKIKQFAIWARTELIEQVSQRAYQYGITADSCGDADAVTIGERALSNEEWRQRRELIKQIDQKGYPQVMEEVAYTWFNRFIALRFMEVNNYLPTHIRVFSDSNDQFKPEILNDVLHLDLPHLDQTKVAQYLEANRTDDLYRYLLLLQCNSLNEALPVMFEPMGSYTEMLLPNNILKSGSILDRLVNDIPAEDWLDQVQIIGWLYQYYNSELKDDTFALLKKNIKVTRERIPAVTQLFTPDWIVRYMVENSLGRLWLEGHPNNETLKNSWQYYLEEAEQTAEVQAQLEEIRQTYRNIKPQEIKIIDPCMGSGHILVYAFDLLMQIYEASGVSQRDAVHSILANNLYGLDIDDRAAQLAYFAIMMKARQYDRRIFSRQIQPHLYSIKESNGLDENAIKDFAHHDPQLQADLKILIDELHDATEYGAIVPVSSVDFAALYRRIEELRYDDDLFLSERALKEILPLIQIAETMAQQYDIVVTNPPYMGASNMNEKLAAFVKKHYPDSKSDLFACFMEKADILSKQYGFTSLITMESWMFLSSFEKLRYKINQTKTIINMVHMPYLGKGGTSLGINFGTSAVIMQKGKIKNYLAQYEYTVYYECDEEGVPFVFPTKNERWKTATQDNFSKIPGSPIAYWVSEKMASIFLYTAMSKIASPKAGLGTGDNDRFLRFWHEVNTQSITKTARSREEAKETGLKWFPHNKGGEFRKWYGNDDYIVDWSDDGYEIRHLRDEKGKLRSRPQNMDSYFCESITWSEVSTGMISFRYKPSGYIYDGTGPSIFADYEKLLYLLAFCNSNLVREFTKILSPTIHYTVGSVSNFPVIFSQDKHDKIIEIVEQQIELSKIDWDSYETSWDFKKNPLV